jgi:stress-induced morphogen
MTPEQIEARLKAAYPDATVAVIDSNGQQDHYDIRISTPHLTGTRIQKHQAILQLFAPEFQTGELHALEIKII